MRNKLSALICLMPLLGQSLQSSAEHESVDDEDYNYDDDVYFYEEEEDDTYSMEEAGHLLMAFTRAATGQVNEFVKKCCEEGERLSRAEGRFSCVPLANSSEGLSFGELTVNQTEEAMLKGFERKNEAGLLEVYHLSTDGHTSSLVSTCLQLTESFSWVAKYLPDMGEANNDTLLHQDKCMDLVLLEDGAAEVVLLTCRNESLMDSGHNDDCKEGWSSSHIAMLTLSVVSAVCLAMAILVYTLVPGLMNLHGKVVICNMRATLLSCLFFITVYNLCPSVWTATLSCVVIGVVGYFVNLSMFSWSTVLATDLCLTFLRPRLSSKKPAGKRYVMYNVVGWGVPSLITLLTVLIDLKLMPTVEGLPDPNIGKQSCFLHSSSHLYFVHLPITLMMILNIVFYLATVVLIKSSWTKKRWGQNSHNRDQFILFTKLFAVMGVLWIFEGIEHYIKSSLQGGLQGGLTVLFQIIGCLNMSRGIFLFLIFVCKRSVLQALRAQLTQKAALGYKESVTGTTVTSAEYKHRDGVEMSHSNV